MSTQENTGGNGLSSAKAKELQAQYGKNELTPPQKESLLRKIVHVVSEPMFLLLFVAAVIYFILGEPRDGAIMLLFVVAMIGIEVVQEWKTDRTLNALKDLSAPQIKVIRDGAETLIASVDLVPGDLMLIHEGVKIPADGIIRKCNDLCVDESSLTGEAEGVWKTASDQAVSNQASSNQAALNISEGADYWRKDYCYAGTLVTQGFGVVEVDAIGPRTEYGKIGMNVAAAPEEATPLQKQTGSLVKLCAGIAAGLFILVGLATWFNVAGLPVKERLTASVLSGITLAMAMIPEEFPVVLTVFLSMGAWRLAKKNSLVRRLPSVETLGAVSILCVDKTGTITMNQMTVQQTWAVDGNEAGLVETMGLACETDAYDPMEKAMLAYCEAQGVFKSHLFAGELLNEYAFTNELKMMGHIWRHDDELIIAVKGSPERVTALCPMDDGKRGRTDAAIAEMSGQGLRVIAVAIGKPKNEHVVPENITDCKLTLLGLVGLADPPRPGVKDNIAVCHKAGIRVCMITGDNGVTAASIARQVGMQAHDRVITGDMLEQMSDEELRESVKTVNIFSRVVPAHKMRIVKAFQENGEIVAMTGDGVNDAPALKYADIGIAMGKRGSEVSREASDLILMDDNFSTIVDTVKDGRRIYDNIRKAVGYIFTIHIPIAGASLLAPMLGFAPGVLLLLPLHVVLLELIVDPTCSVVLERQPAETDIMERKPRNPKEKLLTPGLLAKSLLQGAVIFIVSFGAYAVTLSHGADAAVARSMGLGIIMLANLFLVQVISSDHDPVFMSIRRVMADKVMWAVNLFTLAGLAVILYSPLNVYLKLAPLSAGQLLVTLGLAAVSVLWYEVVKLAKMMWQRKR